MNDPIFRPGFRFSPLDAAVLVLGALLALALGTFHFWIGVAVAFVVGHFFLFCNLVRMSRPLELTWAAAFAILCILATREILSWSAAFALALCITIALILVETRRPSYHGLGWRHLNPHLPDWWRARQDKGAG